VGRLARGGHGNLGVLRRVRVVRVANRDVALGVLWFQVLVLEGGVQLLLLAGVIILGSSRPGGTDGRAVA